MASGYTANYGLCQWQGEDKFLREEFNQDNAKEHIHQQSWWLSLCGHSPLFLADACNA